MKTIENPSSASIEIRKSTFHAFLAPDAQFLQTQKELKSIHPKARHIVWARRILGENEQIYEYSSDDGEPKGTSGPPSLAALRGAELINTSVFIVRYFGGIKLGTGGLVRAYSSATNAAIDEATLIPFEPKVKISFFSPYPLVQRCEYWIEKEEGEILSRIFDSKGAIWEVSLVKMLAEEFRAYASSLEHEGLYFL